MSRLNACHAHTMLAVMALAAGACDTECVGANCETLPIETDLTVDVPQDTAAPDEPETDPGDERIVTLPLVLDCHVVRWHKPTAGVSQVQIAGAFNDWQPAEMSGPDEDGWYELDLGTLAAGTYPYKYLYNGEWESVVPNTSRLEWSGGVENRQLVVDDCSKPRLQVIEASGTASGDVSASIRYALGVSAAPLDVQSIQASIGGTPVTAEVDEETQTITVSASNLPRGKHTVRLTVTDVDGRAASNEVFTPLWVEDQAFRWTDGILYLVFVDRFRNGDASSDVPVGDVAERANYRGGDLLGVLEALEEGWFEDLGIRSIWLSPLYNNPDGGFLGVADDNRYTGYHGYWPINPRSVEDRLGDASSTAEDRLKQVVDAAHERGIRVVLDVVLNHVHDQHEYLTTHPEWFGDGCVCGSFGCGWEEKPIECWFTPYLPDLDHSNPRIVDALVEDTLWWIRHFDLDGLRIDAVKHMHRAMTVNLRHAVIDEIEQGGGAQVYSVGETFTGGGAQQELTERIGPFEMDAQFDFPFYWTVRDVFAYGGSMTNLEATIRAGIQAWGDAPMSSFAGNHDIPRLATAIANNDEGPWADSWDRMAAGGAQVTEAWMIDQIAMSLAVTLTQPGVPLLYYGDEIGLAGSGDPDNRRMMSFDPFLSGNQRALLDKVHRIGQARSAQRALQRGSFVSLWSAQDSLVFARVLNDKVSVVAVNRGDARTLRVPLQGLLDDGTTLSDAMVDGRTMSVEGSDLVLSMEGNDIAILAP